MSSISLVLLLAQAMGAPAVSVSDEAPVVAGAEAPDNGNQPIVVVAERLRATVAGPLEAQVSFGSDAVTALGASNLADILAQLAPLTGGSQGRAGSGPVLLVNGRRIGSFDEVRNLPPEAIQRVDILPEEAALRLGYPATSKPVNIVLKPRYAAGTGELEDRVTTNGLRNDFNTELNLVDIAGDNRMTMDLQYQIGDAITEAKRQVIRPIDTRAASTAGILSNPAGGALLPLSADFAGVPADGRALSDFAAATVADDTGRFHTLIPSTKQFTANGTFARALPSGMALSANAKFDRLVADELLGPAIAETIIPAGSAYPFSGPVRLRRSLPDDPVQSRTTATDTYHFGAQLAGYGAWQWSAAGNFDHTDLNRHKMGGVDATALQAALDSGSIADPFAPPPAALLTARGETRSSSHDQLIGTDLFASGPLGDLPAGAVNLTLGAALGRETIRSFQDSGATDLARNHAGGQASLDLPLLKHGSPIGALDGGLNGSVDRYSDAGTIKGFGATLSWKPAKNLSLLLAASRDQTVPTLTQRGGLVETTPDAAFFDYTTGSSFTAARIDGGNPSLRADRRSIAKAEISAKPLAGLGLTATYTAIHDRDPLLAFPGVSAATEAALTDRIVRNASGAVTLVDIRPFNAASEDRQELRLALTFGKTFSKSEGPRVPGGGGFGGGHSFGAAGSTIQFSLSDTVRLKDRVRLDPGTPAIDLVNGNQLGDGLRVPRHKVDAQLSATHDGFGLRANAIWTSGGEAGADNLGNLRFDDRFQLNFRLFYFPAKNKALAEAMPWLEGVRLLLAVDNPFDSYQRVRDAAGRTPLAYQRWLLDPIGRTVRFSIRKTID
ncbi:hypothetical protein KRR38_28930 [Novosphingobium sp. G106]|uniref:TonB-dependent receptor n=1 Tax=Novosphingobium sp. G106 TaxID=2849500 RepID=UPI001C2D0FC2|nr:TonB-dependent receptor [Novosphingobium sp. G106]MBV1691591.1 hypothetical protein [Novosphingobium sp. G106]